MHSTDQSTAPKTDRKQSITSTLCKDTIKERGVRRRKQRVPYSCPTCEKRKSLVP
ncbi:hypothetical protein BJV77DRAFT_986093 [Russula vinacea]|nr:hypothetical protein BJV77DRAFT_986093 [Russula vinacea]